MGGMSEIKSVQVEWIRTLGLEDTKNFVTSDETNLRNAVRVTESYTDLRRSQTLAGELDDLLNDLFMSRFQPRRWGAAIWQGRGRYIKPCLDELFLSLLATYKCPFRERAYDPW